MNLQGFPVIFVDTAGIRETPDNAIEQEGVSAFHPNVVE